MMVIICDCDGEHEPNSPPEATYLVDLASSQVRSLRTSGFLCTQSGEREKLHTICVIYLFVHNLELFLTNHEKFFAHNMEKKLHTIGNIFL